MSDENTTTIETKGKKPSHFVYHVSGDSEKSRWNKIGAAWIHEDGNGMNVDLEYLPLAEGARIVIRKPSPESEQLQ